MQLPGEFGQWNGEASLRDAPDAGASSSQTILFRNLTVAFGRLAALSAILILLGMRLGITILSSVYPGYQTIVIQSGPGTAFEFRFPVNRRYGE